jgi:hypothetical protein
MEQCVSDIQDKQLMGQVLLHSSPYFSPEHVSHLPLLKLVDLHEQPPAVIEHVLFRHPFPHSKLHFVE